MSAAEFELPLKSPKYELMKTSAGIWKKYVHADNQRFWRFSSHAQLLGRPLVELAAGRDPETGSMAIADGWIAIGQRARGVIAIGQFVNGYVAVGQFATGRIAAVGQFAVAPLALGQMSIGLAALGQLGFGAVGVFQIGAVFWGFGQSVCDLSRLFTYF